MRSDVKPGGTFPDSLAAQWPFLSDPERIVQTRAGTPV